MSWNDLARSETRKLTTTRMPLAFVAVFVVLAGINGVAVAVGTDMDGSKAFISTADDQRSLMAFAANALMITGLFGAIAAAREHANSTVIATYLASPRRPRALLAHFTAIGAAGAVLGLVGTALSIVGIAATLPLTDFGFMVGAAGLAHVLVAAAWAGACGAVLGAAIGTVVRNTGGAVALVVIVLVIAPPLVVQLASATATWIPSTLALVASGVMEGTSVAAAAAAMALWAAVPAMVALSVVRHRDVV